MIVRTNYLIIIMINKICSFPIFTPRFTTDRNMHSGDCKIIKVFASHKEILFLSIGALALGSWLVYKD
ncbi:MAG: hypothetical protein K940chlam9_01745, partial [Chlamydiae bacterium]|nr:hypothetical protein [Chlamydiota bacterium]